jgi:hypothetical protein
MPAVRVPSFLSFKIVQHSFSHVQGMMHLSLRSYDLGPIAEICQRGPTFQSDVRIVVRLQKSAKGD